MSRTVFCIGELLIDMIGVDKVGLKNAVNFKKHAGGAPANVACTVSKLGGKSYFLGQVGDDFFGDYLIDVLDNFNVNHDMIKRYGSTTVAFVDVDKNGERNFSFMRGSDESYDFGNVNVDAFKPLDIIHLGSATALLGGQLKKTYTNMLFFAQERGDFLSYDPNFRESLYANYDPIKYRKECISFISRADFLKVSQDELKLLTQCDNVNEGAKILNDLGARVVCVTLGAKGTLLSLNDKQELIPSIKVEQVDSTGAGDAFTGAVLYQLSNSDDNIKLLSFEKWKEIVAFANKVGAYTATEYGAMNGIEKLDTKGEL